MNDFKLDTHLKDCCSEHPEYMNLYSTWNLNKRTCSDALKTIVVNYPHFSIHDASHADTIISKIEMLLGSRVLKLTPTDTWLLLHASYTHDLGMVLKWKTIEAVWDTSEFQKYLSSLSNTTDNELRNAASFIKSIKEHEDDSLWPLKTHQYVNLINSSFFRGQHAHMSREYIDISKEDDLDIDLGHSNLIHPRLIKLLGRICELHTAPLDEILSLNYQTDGFGSDYAHPRFIAILLRLGDLLDIDNGRFNTTSELVVGGLPKSSIPHKEKHEATSHILVTPEEIQFSSDCPNSQAYLETRNFVTWLESEIDFLTKYWARIVPKEIEGYAPRFDKKELLINGIPDIEGVAGLRFEISQEKAFQIIEGSNIYKDRFIFIREVIQNAMDASKLQLWNDLITGTYHAWIGDKDFSKLQPYDLHEKIYQSYPINIKLRTLPEGTTQIEVTDRGTGISVDTFKRMCNVGLSYEESKKLQTEIESMPKWLQPTAGFGVGLQSIFLLTNKFEINTSTGTEAFHAVVHSNRMGGYLQLQRSKKKQVRGTTIRIIFQMPEQYSFSLFGDTYDYIYNHLDPMSSEDHLGEARILEAIKSNCGEGMLPIKVDCADDFLEGTEIINPLPVYNSDMKINWKPYKERYLFELQNNCSFIKIWDKEKAVYGEFELCNRKFSNTSIFFKGIQVNKNTLYLRLDGICALVDIYGLNTKDTITLDRSSLTNNGKIEIKQILEDMFNVYIECALNYLNNENCQIAISSPKFNSYTFWLLCNFEQRKSIPKEIENSIEDMATVLVKEDDKNEYIKKEKAVKDLIPDIKNSYFLNLDNFDTHIGEDSIEYDNICNLLNQAVGLDIKEIVADKVLTKAVNMSYLQTLKKPISNQSLFLYTTSLEKTPLLNIDDTTKVAVLRGLSNYIKGLNYNRRSEQLSKRYAIPAIEDYKTISLYQVPYSIAKPLEGSSLAIISPFNNEEAKKLSEMSKEGFIEMVLSSSNFNNLVNYVLKFSYYKDTITENKIRESYKRLIKEYYDVMNSPSN